MSINAKVLRGVILEYLNASYGPMSFNQESADAIIRAVVADEAFVPFPVTPESFLFLDADLSPDDVEAIRRYGKQAVLTERERIVALMREALAYLDMISPSGYHVERAREVLIKAIGS